MRRKLYENEKNCDFHYYFFLSIVFIFPLHLLFSYLVSLFFLADFVEDFVFECLIDSCVFRNCSASERGGALTVESKYSNKTWIQVRNTLFEHNFVLTKGGKCERRENLLCVLYQCSFYFY